MLAYVTFVGTNNEYIDYVIVLQRSLKKHLSKFPLLCVVTKSVSQENILKLSSENVKVKVLEKDVEFATATKYNLRGPIVFNKLQMWTLLEYSKLVYLDSDTIVCQNIDHLFDLQTDFAACPSSVSPDLFSTGVFVFKPSLERYNEVMEVLKKSTELNGDGFLLNSIFPLWNHSPEAKLPFGYNMSISASWEFPEYWRWSLQQNRLFVVHFVDKWKPDRAMPSATHFTKMILNDWLELNQMQPERLI